MSRVPRSPAKKDPYFLESLSRGLRLLECFVGEPRGLMLTEAAEKASLELTAAYRIAHTLQETGYLVRDDDTRRYRLGPRSGEMGFAFLSTLDVRQVALPHLHELVAAVRETVSLATLSGGQTVVIERIEAQHALTTRGRVGWAFPAHATSLGKALLAFQPEQQSRVLLKAMSREKLTPATKTSVTEIVAEFKDIRRLGYAVNDEESAADIRAVAAPIRDGLGSVVAAVNIGGPAARITRDAVTDTLAAEVVATAAKVSADLGYRAAARST